MSPLSKILAVLVSLSSIVLACFVTTLVATLENKDSQLDAIRTELKVSESRLGIALAQSVAVNTSYNQVQERADQQIASKVKEIAELTRQSQTLTGEIADLKLLLHDLRVTTVTQSELNQTLSARNTDLQEDNIALIAANTEANAREVDLLNRVNDLNFSLTRVTNEVARLSETYNSHVTKLAALEQRNAEMRAVLEAVGVEDNLIIVAATEIQGNVTGATVTAGGVRLVSLNVGSNDGVTEDMVFTLSGVRNGEDVFLGRAEIHSVDEDACVARVTIESENGDAIDGDAAYILGYLR